MSMGFLGSSWWRKTLPIRVVMYLLLMGLILYARSRAHGPQTPADPDTITTETQSSPAAVESKSDAAADALPEVSVFSWTAHKDADGAQEVWVLARFGARLDKFDWTDLKLRAKDSNADLAEGSAPGATPKPSKGYSKLVFKLPGSAAEFTSGRIHLWTKDLPDSALTAENRMPPEQFDQSLENLRKASPTASN